MSIDEEPFFNGLGETAPIERRFLLGAALGLTLGGSGLAAALAAAQNPPGVGTWNMAALKPWRGILERSPFPMLRTLDLDGTPRTAFLATNGKLGVQARLPETLSGPVVLNASPIMNGRHAMLAIADGQDWIAPVAFAPEFETLIGWAPQDLGETALTGEILDAKCWFGAMRPAFGKTHKACAALCIRGGLPAAFCVGDVGDCGAMEDAPLFLDAAGRAHGPEVWPYVADRVLAVGRVVQLGDVTQFRVGMGGITRL